MRVSGWSSDVCYSRLRAAIDFHLLAIEIEVADELLGADREGLVDFPDVDVVLGQAGLFEHLLRRGNRGVEHQRRIVADIGIGDDASPRLEPVPVGIILRGDEQCGRAVDDTRSEEHTSELQSLMRTSYDVFCLKKKKQQT